jgi:hypothetical protein
MLNMAGVTVTTGGITINGGVVQGYGTIASDVINNGTMIALGGAANGTLDVAGTLSGTGTVLFDQNIQSGSPEATKGTLVLHGVSSGQTITVNSGDTLVLANPRGIRRHDRGHHRRDDCPGRHHRHQCDAEQRHAGCQQRSRPGRYAGTVRKLQRRRVHGQRLHHLTGHGKPTYDQRCNGGPDCQRCCDDLAVQQCGDRRS